MSITEVMSSINLGEVAKDGGIFLILVMTLLQISPIKVNPWSWLGKKIGKAINGEIIDKVDKDKLPKEAKDALDKLAKAVKKLTQAEYDALPKALQKELKEFR